MDTETAIIILQTASQNLGANIGKETNEKEAIDLAVDQLQGILVTQLTALETLQAQVAANAPAEPLG